MRIGIMGGTFDPIHNGHLMLGEYAYQQFHLDEVWYMPNGNPPHKSNPEIRKDLQDRAEMTRLAIDMVKARLEATPRSPNHSLLSTTVGGGPSMMPTRRTRLRSSLLPNRAFSSLKELRLSTISLERMEAM